MKNIFKYSLALLTVILGFVSCDSEKDDNYQPAVISGAQVYFSNDIATTVNLTFSDTKFSIPVVRANCETQFFDPIHECQIIVPDL